MDSTRNTEKRHSSFLPYRFPYGGLQDPVGWGRWKVGLYHHIKVEQVMEGKQEIRKMLFCWAYGFSNTDHCAPEPLMWGGLQRARAVCKRDRKETWGGQAGAREHLCDRTAGMEWATARARERGVVGRDRYRKGNKTMAIQRLSRPLPPLNHRPLPAGWCTDAWALLRNSKSSRSPELTISTWFLTQVTALGKPPAPDTPSCHTAALGNWGLIP